MPLQFRAMTSFSLSTAHTASPATDAALFMDYPRPGARQQKNLVFCKKKNEELQSRKKGSETRDKPFVGKKDRKNKIATLFALLMLGLICLFTGLVFCLTAFDSL